VIHSFWIPKLGGKQDVVPGRINTLILEADHPGRYPGQCTEYCGLSHAYMRMEVVAESPEDYAAWIDDQQQAASITPSDPLAARGFELFQNFGGGQSCMQCHAINGLGPPEEAARIGPDLTHMASRDTFGAFLFDMTAEELTRWLENPAAMKPGSRMPDYGLTPEQIEALVAFLLTLE
jgi:cytochrome c oxidase subunit 2